MNNINLYLNNGNIKPIYLNDSILNESFDLSDIKDKVYSIVGLVKILINLENKKQILVFLKNNSKQLELISKIMIKEFDPFKSDNIISQKDPNKREEIFEETKQILIEFIKETKKSFINFNLSTDKVIELFEIIYSTLIKEINISTMTKLTYSFGSVIIPITSLIYTLIILLNMIFIKKNNEEMSFDNALLKSSSELFTLLKKFLVVLNKENEVNTKILTFFLSITIYKLKLLSLSDFDDISKIKEISSEYSYLYLIIISIIFGTILFLTLKLYNLLPESVEKKQGNV